ncbi:multiubiquitin domain-containing protein [Calidifontibacillus oryziterrae]|uniref:multiubiquitin domain-containing protein n=1 Tax=Calidifontibacillus oryziterrae TaxID=1191699 RepID=UPI0002FB68BB|nr:multiubiquitin domain-containing protein [Calidifontibacillus oryziterrae]
MENQTEQTEVIDLEEYAKQRKNPPKEGVVYRFRVGKVFGESNIALVTGSEILEKVGLNPNQNKLYQKLHGGSREPIGINETVDLSKPGIERFETIPLDATEG